MSNRLQPKYVMQLTVLALIISMALSGCARNEAATTQAQATAVPQVGVATPISREITDHDEFTGSIVPVEKVEIRPRVSGYIASVNFREGHEVHKGDVLFVIDPRPYAAEVKRTQAELTHALNARALAKTERERATKLLNLRAISQEEFDTRASRNEQADANVQAALAALEVAQLNLTFAEVRAPISGMVSRAEVTAGNLVTSGQSLLTILVSIDPVYVEFQGDERVYLKYVALAREIERSKRSSNIRSGGDPMWVGLANEDGYPHQGKLVFLDNALDQTTGTIRMRGLLDNKDHNFIPGLFARVKLSDGAQYQALLIRDSAVGTDQNVKYVFVVNQENKIEYRALKLGPLVDDMRVVREGLQPGEIIVVDGLQRVRPGIVVDPQRMAMDVTPRDGIALLAQSYTKKKVQP